MSDRVHPDRDRPLKLSQNCWQSLILWIILPAMKSLQHTIKAIIRPGEESGYVAECVEIAVVTQGATLDEVTRNLQEATALHLEDEDLAALGLAKNPTLVITMEVEPVYA